MSKIFQQVQFIWETFGTGYKPVPTEKWIRNYKEAKKMVKKFID